MATEKTPRKPPSEERNTTAAGKRQHREPEKRAGIESIRLYAAVP